MAELLVYPEPDRLVAVLEEPPERNPMGDGEFQMTLLRWWVPGWSETGAKIVVAIREY
jgi:hypothetical protein